MAKIKKKCGKFLSLLIGEFNIQTLSVRTAIVERAFLIMKIVKN